MTKFKHPHILYQTYRLTYKHMISKKTKYALHALHYLAARYEKGPILISELSESEHIPQKFLETILLELKKSGILDSKKGKGGGYFLAKLPSQITLGKVMRILGGPLAPVSCVSQTAYRKCDECKDESCCGIRFVMKDVRDAMANILDNTSLEDILKQTAKMAGKESFNYVI